MAVWASGGAAGGSAGLPKIAAIGAFAAAAAALASASALGSLLGTKPFCFPFYRGDHVSMIVDGVQSRDYGLKYEKNPLEC